MRISRRLNSVNLVTACHFCWIIIQYLLMVLILSSISITSLSTFTIEEPKNDLTLCVVRNPNTNDNINKYCPNLSEGHIKCEIVNDRSDCLRKLITGDADFTVLEAEDLLVAQKFSEGNVFITHELRLFPDKTAKVDMVALVNENINSIADMKGKRFCHPGFDANEDWPPLFANYLQEQLIPDKCKKNKSLLENKMFALSEYFNEACIAGAWTTDNDVDKRLKAKYNNLCAICESGCNTGDLYHGRTGALLCLTENIGDIAWVRLDDTIHHFKTENINRTLYRYLCSDGSLREVDGGVPCTWISKPWPVIATRKEPARDVLQVIESTKKWRCKWQLELMELLVNYVVTPYGLGGVKTIENYLNDYSATAFFIESCSSTIKWCVSSNLEARKCNWLKEIAFYHGIRPGIACIQNQNRQKSMEAILKQTCDVFIMKPEEIQPQSGFTSILEILPRKKNLYELHKIGIIVMKNSQYHEVEDLRGKRACMTGYKSIGWNAFYGVMRSQKSDALWECSPEKALSKFFKSIVFPEKNSKNDVSSTYECLISGRGDVAIVDLRDTYFLKDNYLKTICVDGSNDPQCYLSWTSLGSVIVSDNMIAVRGEEVKLLFKELDTWFGSKSIGQSPVISLYGPFDSTDNIIFPAKSEILQSNTSYLDLPRNYHDILKQISDENYSSYICNSAIPIFSNAVLTVLIILLRFF